MNCSINCSIDKSIACILQNETAMSQSFSNLIIDCLVPRIYSLPDIEEQVRLSTILMGSYANYLHAVSCLIESTT